MNALCRAHHIETPGQAATGHQRRWAVDEYFSLPSAAGHRPCVSRSLSASGFSIMIWLTVITGELQSGYGVSHVRQRRFRLIEVSSRNHWVLQALITTRVLAGESVTESPAPGQRLGLL